MSDRIYLSKADTGDLEEEYVLRALRSGWIAPLGPDVEAFEREVAQRTGRKYALALSSGTAALHLALLHVGARPGTAVVVPTLTFAATANAVVYTGATPVFVDATLEDGNVDVPLVLSAVDTLRAEGTEVAAVISVDLFGRCVNYGDLLPGLQDRGIPLVEDAAEALGATHRGRPAGSFGAASALSFNGNKIITTSGGGMLLSDDEELIAHCRNLATQARQPTPWYEHVEIGYNYRLSNILAALGRAQLQRLDEIVGRRRSIRAMYRQELEAHPSVQFLGGQDTSEDNCWLTVVTIIGEAAPTPDQVIELLNTSNIEARHVWKPMHLQPVFRDSRSFLSGGSEELFATGIALPSGSGLRDEDIGRVIGELRRCLDAA